MGRIFTVATFVCIMNFLVACGGDEPSYNGPAIAEESSSSEGDVERYDSEDDMPSCTATRDGDVADVDGDMFVCAAKKWRPLNEIVDTECALPACDEDLDGEYFYAEVSKKYFVCTDGEWLDGEDEPLPSEMAYNCLVDSLSKDAVETEDDLPSCTEKREGKKRYVDDAEAIFQCADGVWEKWDGSEDEENDDPGVESSDSEDESSDSEDESRDSDDEFSGPENASSSSVAGSSSGVATSSATIASSSSFDPSKAYAACEASLASIEKGDSVTWKATRLSGTLKTYDWTFSEGSSITTSKDSAPVVTYSKPGIYTATLVINKGTDSASVEIKCLTNVVVTGTSIEGCKCTNADSTTTLFYKSGSPASSTWQVSGCKNKDGSAANFTYAWSGDATGTGTSATGSFSKEGSFSPKVTVTNADSSTATPTCPSVKTEQLMGASCNLGTVSYATSSSSMTVVPGAMVYFKPSNFSGVKSSVSASLNGEGVSNKSVDISYTSGYTPSATTVSFTAPSKTGTYEYVMSVSGMEVCKATLKVEYPSGLSVTCGIGATSLLAGESTSFTITGGNYSGWTDVMGADATMQLVGPDNASQDVSVNRYYNNISKTVKTSLTPGTNTFKLMYGDQTVCSKTVTGKKPKITGTCAISPSNAIVGEPVAMSIGNFSSDWRTDLYGSSLSMKFTKGDGTTIDTTIAKSSSSISVETPSKPGIYTYELTYDEETFCSADLVVSSLFPTCEVSDLKSIYTGFAFDVTPSLVLGCTNDIEGCSYIVAGGTAGEASGIAYTGGKISGVAGELETGTVTYTLSLINGTGVGSCSFDVEYVGADTTISSIGKEISVSSGTAIKISSDLTSGSLRCYHGGWQSNSCTVNIESASVVSKSLTECMGGSNWGSYIDFPVSNLNESRMAIVSFTGVSDGSIQCMVFDN